MSDPVSRLNAALEGRYVIERELGEGGMATVYLADDLNHQRKVALKVLKPELAAVVGAERFLSEIRVTANLNHPHILPLHDSGEADSFLYYVMPYIEGESLRDRLDREKQLPVDEAVRIATEVADALQAAHEQGVIHRDIKPANILLSRGRPLVADFGIALAVGAAGGSRLTETGLSVGTPYYMSPEQATGDQGLGPPSDTYALACVLYEMLIGDPPYAGSTAQAVLGQIIAGEPVSAADKHRSVPSNVDAAIRKALEKLPADRFSGASDFAAALGDPLYRHGGGARSPDVPAGPWKRLSIVTTTLTAAAVAVALWGWLRPPPLTHPVRFAIPVPGGFEGSEGGEPPPLAISADGRVIVYGESGLLMRRALDQESAQPLVGTEGATSPFLSPDGAWVGFFQNGEFRRMPSEGGVITQIGNTVVSDVWGADWGQDGFLFYGRAEQGMWRLPVGGGAPEPITTLAEHPDENIHTWPQSLGGGSLLLFSAIGTSGKWHDSKVVLKDLTTGDRYTVIEGGAFGHYVPSGYVVYVDEDGTILAVPFDLGARSTTGEAFPVESGVRVGQWGGGAFFAVSDAGVLAFVRGNAWERHLHYWFDRTGRRLSQLGPPMTGAWGLEIEPGGRRVATSLPNNVNDDIHLLEEGMVTPRRLTFGAASEGWPAWSPDGARIAWQSDAGEGHGQRLWTTEVDAAGDPEILYESENSLYPRSWSPDGRWLALSEGSRDSGQDVYVVALNDPGTRIPIHATPSDEWDPQFSPDGDWLAYESNEGGTFQVYVVSFPDVGDPQRVSLVGGRAPHWASSGRRAVFLARLDPDGCDGAYGVQVRRRGHPAPLCRVRRIR